jgi:sugar O-acyltransferase (sialic acid O-acetyltransferase NeuD family)
MHKLKKQIGLIGFGAIGTQVEKLLIQGGVNESNIYYFEDKKIDKDIKRVFGFWDFTKQEFKNLYFIPTIGYLSVKIKSEVISTLFMNRLKLGSFVHETAFINPLACLSNGVVIYPMCNVDQYAIIEEGVLVNNSCIISHNSIIRRSSYISPGVIISGNVEIGENCFIGSGSVISNNVTVGNNCIIGIGSCISKNVPENSYAIGNPFKIKKEIKLL